VSGNQDFNISQAGFTWEIVNHGFESDDAIWSDIAFINATHGWVIGQNQSSFGNGIILHTTDGGSTWLLQLYSNSLDFSTIEILDENILWVTCTEGIVYTTNGGQTWNHSTIISGRTNGIAFINATHGWIGSSRNLYNTVDGGLTWQIVNSYTFDTTPREIHFVSSLEIWIISAFGIYSTKDGGMTWNQNHQRGGWSLSFVSDSEAWAVADNMLAHMTDGETWVSLPNPRPFRHDPVRPPYYTDIEFIDANNGWLVGSETHVAYTPDGGRSWYTQNVPEEMDTRVLAVDFINQTHGWATCWGGILIRTVQGDSLGTLLTSDEARMALTGLGIFAIIAIGAAAIFIRKRKSKLSTPEIH